MNNLNELKGKIEKLRAELNQLFVTEDFESYHEKSKELDKLIEEYIDLEDVQ